MAEAGDTRAGQAGQPQMKSRWWFVRRQGYGKMPLLSPTPSQQMTPGANGTLAFT